MSLRKKIKAKIEIAAKAQSAPWAWRKLPEATLTSNAGKSQVVLSAGFVNRRPSLFASDKKTKALIPAPIDHPDCKFIEASRDGNCDFAQSLKGLDATLDFLVYLKGQLKNAGQDELIARCLMFEEKLEELCSPPSKEKQ